MFLGAAYQGFGAGWILTWLQLRLRSLTFEDTVLQLPLRSLTFKNALLQLRLRSSFQALNGSSSCSGAWKRNLNAPAPAPELSIGDPRAPAPAPELCFEMKAAPAPAPELCFEMKAAPAPGSDQHQQTTLYKVKQVGG